MAEKGETAEAIFARADERKLLMGLDYAGAVTPAEAFALQGLDAARILDVRTPPEWDDDLSHLDNAALVPVEELESRLPELDKYRSGAVLVYDRTGGRSTNAGQILVTHGFKDVSAIDGGLKAYRDWQKAR